MQLNAPHQVNKLKGDQADGIGNVEMVLLKHIQQMWGARGPTSKVLNRQRNVNEFVRKYRRADTEFDTMMNECKEAARVEGISAGFDFISGKNLSLIFQGCDLCFDRLLDNPNYLLYGGESILCRQAKADCDFVCRIICKNS